MTAGTSDNADETPSGETNNKAENMVSAFSRINSRMNEAARRDVVVLKTLDVYLLLELVGSMAGEIELYRKTFGNIPITGPTNDDAST